MVISRHVYSLIHHLTLTCILIGFFLVSLTFVAVSVKRNGTTPEGTGVNVAPSSETVPLSLEYSLLRSESSYLLCRAAKSVYDVSDVFMPRTNENIIVILLRVPPREDAAFDFEPTRSPIVAPFGPILLHHDFCKRRTVIGCW